MGGYNFQLDDEDENQLSLDGPLVEDLADETNLAALPAPKPAAPVTAPASQPVTAGQGGFDNDYMKYWMDQAKQGLGSATAHSKEPVKVSTAPDWYKGGPPPKGGNDWAKALVGLAGGMIAGPAQVAMQDPNRPLYMKMQDAKRAGLAQGLGPLVGSFLDKGKSQYDNELDAAKKQASMTHVSSAGASAGANQASLAARMIGLANQARGIDSVDQNRKFAQEKERNLHDVDSPEAKAQKALLVSQGVITQEQADNQTLFTLQKSMPAVNAAMQEAGKNARLEAGAINKRGDILVGKDAESEAKAEAKRNEDLQRNAEAYIGPDVEWRGGVPPTPETQTKARTIYGAKQYGLHALDRMTQIQKELERMSHGFSGTVDEWLGRFTGPEGEAAQKLVTEAEQLQNYLTIQARQVANMGVPQEWEQTLVKSLNPRAGSLTGFLKGNASWDSLKKSMTDYSNLGLAANGLVPKGQAQAKPTYETTKRGAQPIAKVKGKQVVTEEPMPDVPTTDERLPVTATPPAPKASTGPKQYKVTPLAGGEPFVRQLTPDQVQKALASKKFKVEEQR